MRPFAIALFAVVIGFTSACSHNEPTLADEFADEGLQNVETAGTTPEQAPVETQSLGEASQPAFAPVAPVAPKRAYKKKAWKKRRTSKQIAKAKRKLRKKRNRR